jgi:GNAT superfamily N-acetyltransferase
MIYMAREETNDLASSAAARRRATLGEPWELRAMSRSDARAAAAVVANALADLNARTGARRLGFTAAGHDDRLIATIARLSETDPGGCWVVADAAGEVVGVAVAIKRMAMWGLSLLFVEPRAQGVGVGRALLDQAVAYGTDCAMRVILGSEDPRAARTYRSLGLALHPAVRVLGVPRRSRVPQRSHVRAGGQRDLRLVDEVDLRARGLSRASDVEFLLREGASILIATDGDSEGYAVHRAGSSLSDGHPIMLGADSEAVARDLLREVFSSDDEPIELEGLTHGQSWALDVAIEAGLDVLPGPPVFLSPWVLPPGPCLLSGIYF